MHQDFQQGLISGSKQNHGESIQLHMLI